MSRVIDDIKVERARQNELWGEQNHPDGTHPGYYSTGLRAARKSKRLAAADGSTTFAHILAEEFFEVMSEDDPGMLRAELVQVAAVAVQWVEAIDRRGK